MRAMIQKKSNRFNTLLVILFGEMRNGRGWGVNAIVPTGIQGEHIQMTLVKTVNGKMAQRSYKYQNVITECQSKDLSERNKLVMNINQVDNEQPSVSRCIDINPHSAYYKLIVKWRVNWRMLESLARCLTELYTFDFYWFVFVLAYFDILPSSLIRCESFCSDISRTIFIFDFII